MERGIWGEREGRERGEGGMRERERDRKMEIEREKGRRIYRERGNEREVGGEGDFSCLELYPLPRRRDIAYQKHIIFTH